MARVARIIRRASGSAPAAATAASGLLALGLLAVWGYSFRRPVLAEFGARGNRCRVAVDAGLATADNAPQVLWDALVDAYVRSERIAWARERCAQLDAEWTDYAKKVWQTWRLADEAQQAALTKLSAAQGELDVDLPHANRARRGSG